MSVANPLSAQPMFDRHRQGPALVIFVRAPIPGHCKTRLARGSNARRAVGIYRALLENTVAAARASAPLARISLACTPDTRHPMFRRLARDHDTELQRQRHGDLGQRMHAAIRAGLRRHPAVILMGSDQPALADDWYAAATRALSIPDGAWLAPSTDGGYWAIGLTRPAARIFRGPAWSTPQVAIQTRRRLHRCGFRLTEWPLRNDIDTWRDWRRLRSSLRAPIARRAWMTAAADLIPAHGEPAA